MITIRAKKLAGLKSVIGLIGRHKPEAVFFNTRFGLHTFGMKFPIDIIILDKANKIVKIKKGLKPNRVFFWNIKYHKVIELPPGTVNKNWLMVDNKIKLVI